MNTPQTLGERISVLRGDVTQSDFSATIGISQNTLCRYERNRRTPKASIINQICKITGASPEWLIFGQGDMYADSSVELLHGEPSSQAKAVPKPAAGCPRCAKLEQELKQEREERREVCAENRQLHRDKEELLRENGTLREKLARFEAERGKCRSHRDDEEEISSLFDEQSAIQSSSFPLQPQK